MNRKKVAASIIAAGVAFGLYGQVDNVEAKKDISVILNNEEVDFTNSPTPIIFNDVTYISVRQLFEDMGANVSWNVEGNKRFAKVEREGLTIEFHAGKNVTLVNGKEVSALKPLKIVDDRSMIPLRYVSETLGAKVDWNNETKTVTIVDGNLLKDHIDIPQQYLLGGGEYYKVPKRDGSIEVFSKKDDSIVTAYFDFGSQKRIIVAYPENTEHRLVAGELAVEHGFPMTKEEFAALNRDGKLFEEKGKEYEGDDVIYSTYIQGGPGSWVINWMETKEELSYEIKEEEGNGNKYFKFIEADGMQFGSIAYGDQLSAMYREIKSDPYNSQKREVFATFLVEELDLPIEKKFLVDYLENPRYMEKGEVELIEVIMPKANPNTKIVQINWVIDSKLKEYIQNFEMR